MAHARNANRNMIWSDIQAARVAQHNDDKKSISRMFMEAIWVTGKQWNLITFLPFTYNFFQK